MLADRPADWPFCFGAEPGWADVHLVPQIANARRFDCDLSAFPTICQIDARCSTLDAFRLARPDTQSDYPGEPTQ
jgi:glutathione S-transferase